MIANAARRRLKELKPIPHILGCGGRHQMHKSSRLLTDRIPLTRNDDNAGVALALGEESLVQIAVIARVERVHTTALRRGERKLGFVRFALHRGV